MPDAVTISQTATVRIMLENGDIGFDELAAVYKFDSSSDHIRNVLATSLRTGREVTFTNDRRCKIYTAELAPFRRTALSRCMRNLLAAIGR